MSACSRLRTVLSPWEVASAWLVFFWFECEWVNVRDTVISASSTFRSSDSSSAFCALAPSVLVSLDFSEVFAFSRLKWSWLLSCKSAVLTVMSVLFFIGCSIAAVCRSRVIMDSPKKFFTGWLKRSSCCVLVPFTERALENWTCSMRYSLYLGKASGAQRQGIRNHTRYIEDPWRL